MYKHAYTYTLESTYHNMHKRFLSTIGRRPSKVPLQGFSQKPSTSVNHQEGQKSEKAVPDGDSPEASVSRGVVSSTKRSGRGFRHVNAIKEIVLRVWRTE